MVKIMMAVCNGYTFASTVQYLTHGSVMDSTAQRPYRISILFNCRGSQGIGCQVPIICWLKLLISSVVMKEMTFDIL